MFCSNCGERIDADSHFCVHCGNKIGQGKQAGQRDSPSVPDGTPNQDSFHVTSAYEDMITYTGKNGHYYDRKWKKMSQVSSKLSWNFAAFFLTIFWLGYRRLFKEMFTIVGVLLVLGIANAYFEWAPITLQFINYGIGLIVGIGLGLYGNYLYRRHAEKNVNYIRRNTHSQEEKESLLKAQGGPRTSGVFGAIVVFAIYFGIMFYLLFSVLGAVNQVKHGNLYEYPDITVGEAFDDYFDSGKWKSQQSKANFKEVKYSGTTTVEGEKHTIEMNIIIDSDDEFHFDRIVVDEDELDTYDYSMLIETIFDDAAE